MRRSRRARQGALPFPWGTFLRPPHGGRQGAYRRDRHRGGRRCLPGIRSVGALRFAVQPAFIESGYENSGDLLFV
jgi:hypothetical protein